ncbi:MAG: serine hydrolase [Flavobacteriaceae bacterium]|jgi:CubicO group peptidase (beta-lactamase class C family)|nr:serine hydrolase [Flavobacteriaceae bacterium]MDG1961579.1 serine hydrolase [Flavobacteriaceae bacterium]
MKKLKQFILAVLLVITALVVTAYATNTDYLLKAVRTIYLKGYSTAFLDDYKAFDNRLVETGVGQPWPKHKWYNKAEVPSSLLEMHQDYGTVAYVVIKNDSVYAEHYYGGYSAASNTNSFSMAKSMISGLLGRAIMDGDVESLSQPVGDFFPEFAEGLAKETTLGDLSSMSSGTNWDEHYYSPLSITTRAYFDDHLREVILGLKVVESPGRKFKYASGDTQLLGMVLEKATGRSLAENLSVHFWQPMGAEHAAFWQLDSEASGLEKAYCCVASNALDFARFGKLYKDHGLWQGQRLLDSAFIAKSIQPRFTDSPYYGYGWWLYEWEGRSMFMMRGHLGQYVIVSPKDNVIIVRLGHEAPKNELPGQFTPDISAYLKEGFALLAQYGL